MSQVFLSAAPLSSGQSVSGTLPPANSGDGTGSRIFQLTWTRDLGLLLGDGTQDINQDAVITVTQNSVTLLTVKNSGIRALGALGVGAAVFQPSPSGGAITILNNGPGSVNNVSVSDPDDRGSVL